MSRNIYLQNTPLADAQEKFFSRVKQLPWCPGVEKLASENSVGRVTAEAVFANVSAPHYHAAAMDGIAVKAADTFGAAETNPLLLQMGVTAFAVDTGQPLPPGCDAVIMVEDITETGGGKVEIRGAATPWQHVRPIGEDIVATELILPAGHRVRPQDISALLNGGIFKLPVKKKLRAAVIPTGNELVPVGEEPKPGEIIESNSHMFAALIASWGGEAFRLPITPDNLDVVVGALSSAAREYDLILISAGSSAGRKDYSASAVGQLGELLVHGVAMKPGKPVILGVVHGKPVIGVPGYPVAAFTAMELFARPLLDIWNGIKMPANPSLAVNFSRRVVSSLKDEEFIRVKVGKVDDKYIATPLSRGSGISISLVRADGTARVPQNREGVEAGETVTVELWRTLEEIDGTVVHIGSHDPALDILSMLLKQFHPSLSLSSAHVGSMGGIMALKRGEAHLAGIHLLDENAGQYNISYLQRLLPDEDLVLINLVEREQGLMVKPGNPEGIKGIEDLAREGIRFINRQRGAGTRLLLDYRLKQLSISPGSVAGYEREEYTHLAVAAAVAGGSAHCGLGVLSAARALGLDFIPVARERYDLAIPRRHYLLDRVQALLRVIRSGEFRDMVAPMGGYHFEHTGKIIWESKKEVEGSV